MNPIDLAIKYSSVFDDLEDRVERNTAETRRLEAKLEELSEDAGENAFHDNGKNPGDTWEITTKGFSDAHFAVYPPELVEKPVKAGCPKKVCAECGTPYVRDKETPDKDYSRGGEEWRDNANIGNPQRDHDGDWGYEAEFKGWKQGCDCDNSETHKGLMLDPFMGAGTTGVVARQHNRNYLGIEINEEYASMAQKRIRDEIGGKPLDSFVNEKQ